MLHRLLTVLLVFVVASASAQVTAPAIIQKYVHFLGGETNLKAIHSRIDSGDYNYGGIEFPFVAYAESPDLYRYTVSFKGKYFAQAFDGKQGWKIDVFKGEKNKTVLRGRDARKLANEVDVAFESPFIDYAKKGYQATVMGLDTVDQHVCYRIRLVGPVDTAIYAFDQSSGALLKKTAVAKNAELNNAVLATYYSEYTGINNIQIPFKTVHKIKDQVVLTVTIKSCVLNQPVPADIFSL